MTRGHMQMFASRRSCLWDRLFWSIDSAACVGWFNDHPRFWRVVTKIQPQWQSSKSNPNLYARRLVEHLQSHLSRHGVLWWRSKRSHPGLKEEDEETERSLKIKLQQDPTRVAQRGESIRVGVPNIGFASYCRYWMILCIYIIYICILYTCRYSHFKMVWTMLTPSFFMVPPSILDAFPGIS